MADTDDPTDPERLFVAVVTSIRVRVSGGNDQVSIWNRGALAGTITMQRGDGEQLAKALGLVEDT